jgi:hypothetical protein
MDDEPRADYFSQCYENTALRQTPGGECLCKLVASKLPWRIPMVRSSHNYSSDVDEYDHRA